MPTSNEKASNRYSVELASRNPKWHFIRVVGTLLGIPYQRPQPYEADDLRQGEATPRFRLLIKDVASGNTLSRRNLVGASVANEAMHNAEKDLEQLTVSEFREKYAIRKR